MGKKLALRIDDIGASTKRFERYSHRWWLNIGILRDRRLFGEWGPYRELEVFEWFQIFTILRRYNAKLTVAVTACWVERDGSLVPFHKKFPKQAEALKLGQDSGFIDIAAHGLTHCIVKDKAFLPGWFGSNRRAHKEYYQPIRLHMDESLLSIIKRVLNRGGKGTSGDARIGQEIIERHTSSVKRSIEILRGFFKREIKVFVPPGNIYSLHVLDACEEMRIDVLNCERPNIGGRSNYPKRIGNENILAFHDRDLVLHGISWLEKRLREQPINTDYIFVKDLYEENSTKKDLG